MSARLRILKATLGGDLCGSTLTCPTIGHGQKDRGTSYTDRPGAPNDLLVFVHNGTPDDALAAKDRALRILGEEPAFLRRRQDRDDPIAAMQRRAARRAAEEQERADVLRRQQLALAIWEAGRDPRGTAVQRHLQGRGLDLPEDIALNVLRSVENGRWAGGTAHLMVALMRCVRTGEPRAIHRTALTPDGRKIGRRMLGPAAGTAVMLDAEEAITTGLTIGEGIESCLAAQQLGIHPTWALGSADAIRLFPVLPGIETLTVLAENDENGASARACRAVGTRWHRAGRTVEIVTPRIGNDMNDALRGGVAA